MMYSLVLHTVDRELPFQAVPSRAKPCEAVPSRAKPCQPLPTLANALPTLANALQGPCPAVPSRANAVLHSSLIARQRPHQRPL